MIAINHIGTRFGFCVRAHIIGARYARFRYPLQWHHLSSIVSIWEINGNRTIDTHEITRMIAHVTCYGVCCWRCRASLKSQATSLATYVKTSVEKQLEANEALASLDAEELGVAYVTDRILSMPAAHTTTTDCTAPSHALNDAYVWM